MLDSLMVVSCFYITSHLSPSAFCLSPLHTLRAQLKEQPPFPRCPGKPRFPSSSDLSSETDTGHHRDPGDVLQKTAAQDLVNCKLLEGKDNGVGKQFQIKLLLQIYS